VLDRLDAVVRAGHRAALATVIRVRGSAYRREGAKLLVADDGSTTGNVSGGCLEYDVREVGLAVLRSGEPQLRTYCPGTDADALRGTGLGCEGEIELFVEPAFEARPHDCARLKGRAPFVVCSIVAGSRDAVGERLTVTSTTSDGSIGASNLKARVAARARELMHAGHSALEDLDDHTVFFDVLDPPPRLVVCGAGDDARPLARFATDVGFQVSVVDRRPAMLGPGRFPTEVECFASDGDSLSKCLSFDKNCYAVIMTHNLDNDLAYLRSLLASPVRYVGILGPRQRTERLLAGLELALDDSGSRRVYGPVGLDIGAEGAEQVALAVIAEILAARSGRPPRSLRERVSPIHANADA